MEFTAGLFIKAGRQVLKVPFEYASSAGAELTIKDEIVLFCGDFNASSNLKRFEKYQFVKMVQHNQHQKRHV